MEFNFNPIENIKSFNEFNLYNIETNLPQKYINLFLPIFIFTCIFFLNTIIFTSQNTSFSDNIKFILGIIAIISPLIYIQLLFKEDSINNTLITNEYSDINCTNYFLIDNNTITKKNDINSVTLLLTTISKIIILEDTLILSSHYINFFIPITSLPTDLESFISIFKNSNKNIIIKKQLSYYKKLARRNIFMLLVSILLSFLLLSFINTNFIKNNFITYNLIPANETQKLDNSYFYKNDTLDFCIYFPQSWKDHYGIEELDNEINVYYLADGKQSTYTTLLFKLKKGREVKGTNDLYINGFTHDSKNNIYTIFTQNSNTTTNTLPKNSPQYKEYMNMLNDILTLKIE